MEAAAIARPRGALLVDRRGEGFCAVLARVHRYLSALPYGTSAWSGYTRHNRWYKDRRSRAGSPTRRCWLVAYTGEMRRNRLTDIRLRGVGGVSRGADTG